MEGTAMRAYHVAGFVALLFWQVAPVQLETGPGGRFRLSFAGATGQWEDYQKAQFNCDGSLSTPERSTPVEMGSVGARADMFLGEGDSRLVVVAGRTTEKIAGDTAAYSSGSAHWLFWGAEILQEGPSFGVGAGYRHTEEPVLQTLASQGHRDAVAFYLRYGKLDKVHLRAEVGPISETPSLAGEARLGVGFGQGRRRQVSGFIGLVLGPQGCSSNCAAAAFGDLGFPLAPSVDLLLRGVGGPGHLTPQWGLGGGLRASWGR
jgi:hypothetical protein